LKDLNKFPIPELFYSQMWLNLFMDDCELNNIAKMKIKSFVLSHIGENKDLYILKKWTYILHNENNIVKDLMKDFLIHIGLNHIYKDRKSIQTNVFL
jgi:hypothetical protein